MNNTLYLECYSGISGDMTVAALLDLGASQDILKKALDSLPVDGFEVRVERVKKAGLDVCDFRVILDDVHENNDHDMEYLHGKDGHQHSPDHQHSHEQQHLDDHLHLNNQHHSHKHHHVHEHRGLKEIIDIINQADLTNTAKNIATRIFEILAQAEAKAHGVEWNQVHFHEVGAVDSIVDIVAIAVCIDNLGIKEVIVPSLYEGRGFVRCQHGVIPIPVPAVTNIVASHNLHLHLTETEGELVTPTGAAIVAALKTRDTLPKQFSIKKIGIGAGKRTYDRPSILRAMIIEEQSSTSDEIVKLESNIDDCSGERLGFVMERLFEAGARDVHYIPCFMKKNRPAYQLNVICIEEDIETLEQIIFEETTTIGIRKIRMERSILERQIVKIQTSLGEAYVKVCKLSSGDKVYPEYNSVIELCKTHKMPYEEVYHKILEESTEMISVF